ncbi:SDR family NAD(P)-dependent oxidoreductase [Streptomyces phaeolivaceus]|uniref:SDR family NAD(P)-dependent oxidoreductase n=1 Tax=Streptomyces phaeolivaceus TaxID=2653200 RepID=A0A5P8JVS7_9ACTN|nr:type I polyketide synthase [Streptomyces phaeolivaceus]QFQ95103.1 SDR family NAD(P)-dependent oxidoreductase [Streptomyces phaeolivaceus]
MTASTEPARPSHVPIAVIGTAALTPGASATDGFWRNVLTGRDLITDVPEDHWLVEDYYDPDPAAPDRTYARRGAFLPATDFDPSAYGIPPNALPSIDTTQLLALTVAERVLADAGLDGPDAFDGERTGVILGTAALELLHTMSNRMQRPVWLKSLRESGVPEDRAQEICDRIAAHYVPWQEESFPGVLGNVVAGRIAGRFDLHGTNYTTDAACGSSLAAVTAAANELAVGTADLMITGGVDTLNDILMYMCFSKTPALSRTGDCRPFAEAADGTMLGEALVMFALKRLTDAERDGDRIHAVLRGVGTSSDGRGSAIYSPVPAGQARALRRAYASAGYGPDSVELVEAHGTGTTAGDAAEFTALRTVFEESGRRGGPWCALGSVKSQIGHTKSAAGAAGLLKAVLALRHQVLPPTIKVERPNPALELETSPLYLNTDARPWVKAPGEPRRASVSSFGFGGTNFHMTLEEYVPTPVSSARPAARVRTAPTELFVFGAASPEELLARAGAEVEVDGTGEGGARALADAAREALRAFRPSDPCRLALTASSPEDLANRVRRVTAQIRSAPDLPLTTPDGTVYRTGATAPGQLALLFSGQGSQYPGMGADLALHVPAAREVWDRATALGIDDELPLHRVVFPVPVFTEEERTAQRDLLTRTEWAQPALAVQSAALLTVLRATGVAPDCVAGHSFGELVALHAAGALDEAALIRLARTRGEAMRDACAEPGAMLAVVGVPREDVDALLDGFDGTLWLANDNAPDQVVLSGKAEAVTRLEGQLAAEGVTVRRLRASGAFHSPLMAEAAEPLAEYLDGLEFRPPRLDVYGNADAEPYPESPARVRDRLAEHLLAPVRFVDGIEAMYKAGVRTFVEVGAGATLTGLAGEILGDRDHLAVSLDRRGVNGLTALQQALGTLAVSGVAVDLEALWNACGSAPDAADHAPRPRPRMAVPLSGANHGALYPPPGGAAALPRPVPAETTSMPTPMPMPMPMPVAAPTAGAVADTTGDPWLLVFQETQRQAAQAHAEFQRTMAESHLHFLRTFEASSLGAAGVPAPEYGVGGVPALERVPLAPPLPMPTPTPVEVPDPASTPVALGGVVPAEAAVPTAPAAPAGPDVDALLLDVVAEKTGFPADILEFHMELETDLGIDSIKRVQILSALREKVPALATVDPHELAPLRTLRQIADKLHGGSGPGGSAVMPTEHTENTEPAEPVERLAPPPPTGRAEEVREEGCTPVALTRAVTGTVPAPLPGLELPGLRNGLVLVTDEGTGVAQHLVTALGEHGVTAAVTTEAGLAELVGLAGSAAPADSTDPAGSAPRPGGEDVRGLVLLTGLRPAPTDEAATSVNREAFAAARSAARWIAGREGVFVTVQDTGGDFGLDGAHGPRAWLGGPAGLARTAAKEWPGAWVKAVDCERGDRDAAALAEVLATELLRGGSSSDIGLRADGTRRSLVDTVVPLTPLTPLAPAETRPESSGRLGPDSVIVATGGGRGVTALALRALAEAHLPSLVLLGRTELVDEPPGLTGASDATALKKLLVAQARERGERVPGPAEITALAARVLAVREIQATIDAIEATATRVRYLTVDTRDPQALAGALDTARREYGPISGIVHGAGVLADGLLAEKSDAQFDDVFDTKVEGLRALLAATADDPLDLVCVFSSVAGRFGNTGQGDYAMANEVLAQVASTVAATRPDCLVKSLAWGPWDGGMVGPELREHFREQGVALIPPDAGAQAFLRELRDEPGRVRVTLTAGDPSTSLGAPVAPATAGDLLLSARTHPYLLDHSVTATPVVPMALVAEWFLGAARAWRPDASGFVLRDLQVLSRIDLIDFASGAGGGRAHGLSIRAVPDTSSDDGAAPSTSGPGATAPSTSGPGATAPSTSGPSTSGPGGSRDESRPGGPGNGSGPRGLVLELSDGSPRPAYRATVDVLTDRPLPGRTRRTPGHLDPPPAEEGHEVYDGGVLFHGPAFHAITSVEGISATGAEARVRGVRDLDWPGAHWHSDPAALDAGLQLALKWAEHAYGAAFLPMGAREIRTPGHGPIGAGATCVVAVGEGSGELDVTCDIALLEEDGTVHSELLDVTLVRRPDTAARKGDTR